MMMWEWEWEWEWSFQESRHHAAWGWLRAAATLGVASRLALAARSSWELLLGARQPRPGVTAGLADERCAVGGCKLIRR
jgi:hypothetical protein